MGRDYSRVRITKSAFTTPKDGWLIKGSGLSPIFSFVPTVKALLPAGKPIVGAKCQGKHGEGIRVAYMGTGNQ